MNEFANVLKDAINNGTLLAGISAGTEAALDDVNRLPIVTNAKSAVDVYKIAMEYLPVEENAELDKMKVCAMIIVYGYGIVSSNSNDSKAISECIKYNRNFSHEFDLSYCSKILTIIVATKINYFLTNHHVGQGTSAPFIRKVYNALFNKVGHGEISKGAINVIHCISHWADTRYILHNIGINGIRNTLTTTARIHLAADFKMRKNIMPAGSAAVAICYTALLRLSVHPLRAVFPRVAELGDLVDLYKKIKAERARYHIASSYLTGLPRYEYDSTNADGLIGPLGSFIVNIFPNSSLANTPKFKRGQRLVYKDAEFYDDGFDGICARWKKSAIEYDTIDIKDLPGFNPGDKDSNLRTFDEIIKKMSDNDSNN